jgi:hypothetical protein
MKKLILFIVILVNSFSLFAQDVGISGTFLPTSIPVGTTTNCTVSFANNDFISIPVGGVWIQVNFPPQYSASDPPVGDLMNYFETFEYDEANGVWFGYNTQVIPTVLQGFAGADFVFTVTGNAIIGANTATLFDTDFEDWTDQETNDNQAQAGVIVTAATPIELLSFTGESRECGKIDLTWKTSTEINNDYMEILRSTNGKDFTAIGKVKGTNGQGINTYSLTDDNDLFGGTKYYYMIKQVDFDGTVSNHKLIVVKYICRGEAPKMSVYPNPASEKINISVSNLEDRDINATIINKEGAIVKKIVINSEQSYELELKDLPSGVYKIQSFDLEQPLLQSFIRVK